MTRKIKLAICVLGSLILLFIDWRMSVGWLIGWTCLLILEHFRHKFYGIIFDEKQFTVKKYVAYIVFVFAILWLPLLLAFLFPQWINPYALAASYILERFLMFISGAFRKGDLNGTS